MPKHVFKNSCPFSSMCVFCYHLATWVTVGISYQYFLLFLIFRETNSLVEEFMLLANISVAKKIFQHFPEFAVLRRHPSPPPANYDILVKAARSKVSCCFCFSLLQSALPFVENLF